MSVPNAGTHGQANVANVHVIATVGELRTAIASFDDDAEVVFVQASLRIAVLEHRLVKRLIAIGPDALHPVQRALLYGDAT